MGVPIKASSTPAVSSADGARHRDAKGPRGAPKFELEKDKWIIENYENAQDLKLAEVTMGQLVFIANCRNVTIQVCEKLRVSASTVVKKSTSYVRMCCRTSRL